MHVPIVPFDAFPLVQRQVAQTAWRSFSLTFAGVAFFILVGTGGAQRIKLRGRALD
jgi:hypothetical protein